MKLYTKTGDDGTTGLFGGGRVPKASARVEAYGTVDETNAFLGVARTTGLPPAIDEADAACAPLKSFVLPGGSPQAAALHVARTVCRRAERAVLALDDAPARGDIVVYLNRLSDLLFALARWANVLAAVADVPWKPRA